MPVSVHHPKYKALRSSLAAFRKDAGLSQIRLAELLGVGQSYVSKIERAEAYVDVFVYIDWVVACGVSPSVAIKQLTELITPEQSKKIS